MRSLSPLPLLLLCATTCPSARSPLAKAWDDQAIGAPTGAPPTPLTDSLAASSRPAPLPAAAISEFRAINPEVGLEDSVRAVYRLQMGKRLVGYVVRLPSTEGPYLALIPHRFLSNTWGAPVLLAQRFGDAGWFWEGRSWVVDLDRDGYVEVVSRWHWEDFDQASDSLPPKGADSLAVMSGTSGVLTVHPVPPNDPLWQRFTLVESQ